MTASPGESTTFQRTIGEHEVRVDSENILTLVFRGTVRVADMRQILHEHDGMLMRDGELFVLSDLRMLRSVEPGARHVLGTRPASLPGYCVAYMVSSFQMKLFLDVLLRAANFKQKGKVQYRFFDAEAAAYAWLRQMQQQRERR